MAENDQKNPILAEFVKLLEKIPSDITNALIKQSDDEDEKNIIKSFVPILDSQFKEVSSYILMKSSKSSLQNRAEVETFLRISSGVNVAKNLKLALPSIGSLIGKLGIVEIVQTIKKIICKIIEIFGNKPGWLEALFLIIDEIINTLFGKDSIKVKNILSQAEQNFLSERRHLKLLEKAGDDNKGSDDDED